MEFVTHTTRNESCVDTVRILHQTIVTLRAALEKSRCEILELKSRNWPNNAVAVEDTVRNLSIENHILRQKVLNQDSFDFEKGDKQRCGKRRNSKDCKILQEKVNKHLIKTDQKVLKHKQELKNSQLKEKEKNTDDIYISLDNNIPKPLQSLEKVTTNQLSKSQIICFSNTFEGETHVSTSNSLFTGSLKPAVKKIYRNDYLNSDSQNIQNVNVVQEVTENNNKRNTSARLKKNIQFEEELIDNIALSQQGSISHFISEKQNNSKNELTQYTECINKSEKLIKKPQQKEEQKEEAKDINSNLKNNLSAVKGKQKKSTLLPEHTELSFTEIQTRKKKQLLKLSKSDKSIIPKELTRAVEIKNPENIDSSKLEYNVKKDETSKEDPVKDLDIKLETVLNALQETPIDINALSQDDENKCTKLIELTIAQENEAVEENQIKENPQSQISNSNIIQDAKTAKNTILAEQLKENNIEDANDTEESTNTTDKFSNTKHKNIEISVKIYKKLKKPIEIDIQTKKQAKKKKNKEIKMNNKSQNTSFDKESTIPITNQLQSTDPTEINIDNASADNIVDNILQNDIEQEVDDIELIFTTDDTKETDFKEELVPIDTYGETQLLQCPLSDYEEKLSIETSDRELEDDVFNDNFENENQENSNFQSQTYDFRRENSQIYNSKSDNSINHEDKSLRSYYSYQDSSFENKSMEKDESFDRFEEKVRIIETDISKIGIQDVEYNLGRRNTCPNPLQYKPIIHREALGRGGLNARKSRPIAAHSNVIRKESGVQTDISALPGSSWRSESSLGHKIKVGENFTTLPSKFPHPGSRLRLSEKTVEARRVLLSDIGFTSMVPELSRSADHLCPPTTRGPVVSSYGQFLRTTDLYSPAYTSQKFAWTTTTPSEGSHSQSRYSSQYPLSSPPAPRRRCSAPVSPSKKTAVIKNTPSKVRFANGSLPELRGDWVATVDSGDSTDSLVEEAEHFLRRSIDCLAPCRDVCYRSDNAKITGVRRASAPEPSRDNVPPQGWQPFLPRIARDLHLDYWVKVISPEGRVRGGRVRYVGPLLNQSDSFVGVQLSTPDGLSDGTYNSRRYFNCEPYHGLFVPFKKIIMGWRP